MEPLARLMAGYLAVSIEFIGLILNGLALWLIKRQACYTLDMWLAFISILGDIILIVMKLSQWIFFKATQRYDIFNDTLFSRVDIFITCFATSSSMLCVGMLALVRWWVIVKSRETKTIYWIVSFFILQFILSTLLILVIMDDDFTLMPFKRYYFLDPLTDNGFTLAALALLIIWNLFSLSAVNIAYPLLIRNHFKQVYSTKYYLGYYSREVENGRYKQKIFTCIKMGSFLVIYNFAMMPSLIVMSLELIQRELRSQIGDCLFGVSLLLLTIVNPLALICLHEDIANDLKSWFKSIFFTYRRCNDELPYYY